MRPRTRAAFRLGERSRPLVGPLLLASAMALPVGWFLPLFTARVPFLVRHEVSVASGLAELWRLDLVLFAIVLLFAVIMPLAKSLATLWVWYRMPHRRAVRWLRVLALLAKLSMTEIFLLAVAIVGFKGVGIGRVEVAWGLYAFTAIALLSLAASLWAFSALPAREGSPAPATAAGS